MTELVTMVCQGMACRGKREVHRLERNIKKMETVSMIAWPRAEKVKEKNREHTFSPAVP